MVFPAATSGRAWQAFALVPVGSVGGWGQKECRLWSGNRVSFKHSSSIYWPSDRGQITLSPRAVMRMKWNYVRKELDTVPATQKGPDIVQSILSQSLLRTPPGPKPSLEPEPSQQLWVLNTCPNLAEFFLLGPVFIFFPPPGCSFKHVSCLPSTHQLLHGWLCRLQSHWSVLWSHLGLAIKPIVLSPSWDHPDLNGPVCRAWPPVLLEAPLSSLQGPAQSTLPLSLPDRSSQHTLCQSIYFAESGCLINVYWPNAGFLLFLFSYKAI